ncbi:Uncharacterised protein [Pseudomonas fluorescens]|uniref:Uncharacterized protein n=1 Tax=Pseudomonas fluorescens TaxID=294 RepID=A0A3S4R284_PSEFL|nr:hypothetical protein [Pseudomonas fluorescens]VEF08474.1 Uncharacterised protein [Pseudomonas fluorescens]
MDTQPKEKQPAHIVNMSDHFEITYLDMAANELFPVDNFITHVEENGLILLEGRLKKSDDIPTDDGEWLKKVLFVREHNLWHYHIGYPSYDPGKPFGDRTSEYVLHLQRHPCGTKTTIVHWAKHPPFKLPSLDYFIATQRDE